KFEKHLTELGDKPDGQDRLRRILATLADEARLAVIWSVMLKAGAGRPDLFAEDLVPLACSTPVLVSPDTRYSLGEFLKSAYAHLQQRDRQRIEEAILALGAEN